MIAEIKDNILLNLIVPVPQNLDNVYADQHKEIRLMSAQTNRKLQYFSITSKYSKKCKSTQKHNKFLPKPTENYDILQLEERVITKEATRSCLNG